MKISAFVKKMNLRRNWPLPVALFVVAAALVTWLSWPAGNKDPAATSENEAMANTTVTTAAPTPSPTPIPTPEPTPTPGLPQIMDINLLTGQRLEQTVAFQPRPVAVMINNTNKALPQIGIAAADLIFEMEVEGGITRLMAVFPSAGSVPKELGSLRSARHNYVDLACGMDYLLVHVGGSFIALDKIRDEKIVTIDMLQISAPFWRDQEWMDKRGYAHSVKTSGTRLTETIERRNIDAQLENPVSAFSFYHPQQFIPADGSPALYLHVPFSRHTQAEFFYDEETRDYSKHQFGRPHLDMAIERAISFTNVILLQTEVKAINNKGHMNADLSAGKGFYISGGHWQEIAWEKGDTYAPLQLFNSDGAPLQVNVGKSYIGIVSDSRSITFAEEKQEG